MPSRMWMTLVALVPPILVGATSAQAPTPTPAVAIDAIRGILAALDTHRIVAVGEGPHGNEQGHAFRLALIRDSQFADRIDDIVVEFGSGKYQSLMDRFVRGEDVPRSDLKHAWQDTTASGVVWDRPIYEEFFEAVRTVNKARGSDQQMRVLLGDAPIDWSRVRSHADLRRWGMQKDAHASDVIKREVLAKGRRALVIFGDGHLQGRPLSSREGSHKRGLTNLLEAGTDAAKIFAISSSFTDLSRWQPDVSSWPVPSVATIEGTPIGRQFYASFYPIPPAPGWSTTRLQDHFDAVLYLGPPSAMSLSRLPPSLCHDTGYMKMRLSRMAMEDIRIRQAMIDGLKTYCAAQ